MEIKQMVYDLLDVRDIIDNVHYNIKELEEELAEAKESLEIGRNCQEHLEGLLKENNIEFEQFAF